MVGQQVREDDLVAVRRVIPFDFDHQIGVGQPDPVSCRGTVEIRVGASLNG